MFNRLKRLYQEGKIGVTELDTAITKGWITEEQKAEIIGENGEE